MNFLAGVLLIMFPSDPESALWLLLELIDNLLPADYFTSTMSGVYSDLMVLDALLLQRCPRVAAHLKNYGIELEAVCLSWFSCAFLLSLPIESAFRVWDSLMLEGSKILFRVSLALFVLNEEKILSIDDASALYMLVKDMGKPFFDCDKLMECAFNNVGSLSKASIADLRYNSVLRVKQKLEQIDKKRENYLASKEI